MYTQRIIHFPAFGKGAELQAALEDRCKTANAAGSPHSLSQRMFSAEPAFVTLIRHESLAALGAYQQHNATDPTYLAQIQKIGSFSGKPASQELFQVLLPRQGSAPVGYALNVRFFPIPGKGPDLRRLLEDRIRANAPGTVGAALGAQVAPPDGAALGVTILFSDLAGMDRWRAAQAEDPSFQRFVAAAAALSAKPNHQEMARVLIPFPAM